MKIAFFAAFLAVIAFAAAHKDGAPPSACQHMTPGHGVKPREQPAPYTVTTSTKVVQAGTPMTVTVSGNTPKDTIKGIMLQARLGNKIVGVFTVDPDNVIATTMKCDADGDTVTHKGHEPEDDQQTVTFTWTPPADLNDIVTFRATVVRSFSVFWVGIESAPVKVTL